MLVCELIQVPFLPFFEHEIDLAARRAEREKFREVDVGATTVMINPWPSDMARLLVRDPNLRALSSPSTFAVWPAEEVLHQPMQRALEMDERARRFLIDVSKYGQFKVGRFQVKVEADNRDKIEAWMLGPMMRRALSVRS